MCLYEKVGWPGLPRSRLLEPRSQQASHPDISGNLWTNSCGGTIEIKTLRQKFYIVLVISLDFRKKYFYRYYFFLIFTLTTIRSERCDVVRLGQLTLFLFSNVVGALAYIATAIPLISFSSFSLRYKPSSASHISLPFPAL